jgi:hypothetical protein
MLFFSLHFLTYPLGLPLINWEHDIYINNTILLSSLLTCSNEIPKSTWRFQALHESHRFCLRYWTSREWSWIDNNKWKNSFNSSYFTKWCSQGNTTLSLLAANMHSCFYFLFFKLPFRFAVNLIENMTYICI